MLSSFMYILIFLLIGVVFFVIMFGISPNKKVRIIMRVVYIIFIIALIVYIYINRYNL